MDPRLYGQNRPELEGKLAGLRGQWVAISEDGSKLLAAAPTMADLEGELGRQGIRPDLVVFERVPEDDDLCLGGGELG